MLDKEHDKPLSNAHYTNIYTRGRVGEHDVVIACLPEGQMGTNSAAAVAVQMKLAFSSMRFCLIVGIGGGVSCEEADIRLGDVVVSKPHKAKHMTRKGRVAEYLSKFNNLPDFTREAAGPDILFDATYDHKGRATCGKCSREYAVARGARRQDVVVHYGTVASGNQVMRSAAEKDKVSAELGGVLCFEMEAAGLMNSFSCLDLRGICDYADSHKNKRWQSYAAAMAAAYGKEVLSVIPPSEVMRAHTVDESVQEN
jgi:nucleoside phosphorylase